MIHRNKITTSALMLISSLSIATINIDEKTLQTKPIVQSIQGGISLGADFSSYSVRDLGTVPGLPFSYGGLTFKAGDPNTILIGGGANSSSGKIYEIAVTRDSNNHVIGFNGSVTGFGNVGEYNDGGITYAPNGVLLTAQWPVNNIGQTKPGSTDEDKIVDMGAIGVSGTSVSAIKFVPDGFAGAGLMKLVSWSAGNWYTIDFSEDGSGTYDFNSATQETVVPGGPEGFVYIESQNVGFPVDSLLVSEYSANRVSAYEIDGNGDPVVSTRRNFISGLTGAEGAAIDPLTGDFLFSTFGSSSRVIAINGFNTPGTTPSGDGTLSISFNGSGTITSNPSGINCPSDCSGSFPVGTDVTLSITPETGFTFTGWSGACSGLTSCIVTISNTPSTVSANFAPIASAIPQVIPTLSWYGYLFLMISLVTMLAVSKVEFEE